MIVIYHAIEKRLPFTIPLQMLVEDGSPAICTKGSTITVDNGKQIIKYLEEVAKVLGDLQVTLPFYLMIAGGAYMLLQKKRRSTEDIDFALLDTPQNRSAVNEVLRIAIKKGEISGASSLVPYATEFKQAVEIVARRHKNLPLDWLNDQASIYYYDDAPIAEIIYWRSFGNLLHVYLPTAEYMFATKIAAFRPKDEKDLRILIQEVHIQTREQAKVIVDKFLLPDAQEFWEVDEKLEILFP